MYYYYNYITITYISNKESIIERVGNRQAAGALLLITYNHDDVAGCSRRSSTAPPIIELLHRVY